VITEQEIILTVDHYGCFIATLKGWNVGGRTELEAISRIIEKDL